jgi:hypothetical protein
MLDDADIVAASTQRRKPQGAEISVSNNSEIHTDVGRQLDELSLQAGRPLIVSDADEVLFAFMASLEGYLNRQDLIFDWSSFALTGNIRRRDDNVAIDADEVRGHLATFFARHTEDIDPVDGAARSLAMLSDHAQIVVLSNLPLAQRPARQRALAKHGMDYPLVANIGAKGAAVRALSQRVAAPTVFIDDIPRHHSDVRSVAPEVWCLHFVADRRLARLLAPAEQCDHRADRWDDAAAAILTFLGKEPS